MCSWNVIDMHEQFLELTFYNWTNRALEYVFVQFICKEKILLFFDVNGIFTLKGKERILEWNSEWSLLKSEWAIFQLSYASYIQRSNCDFCFVLDKHG
jgi:hypothetical protein